MTNFTKVRFAAGCLVALALAACGGGSGSKDVEGDTGLDIVLPTDVIVFPDARQDTAGPDTAAPDTPVPDTPQDTPCVPECAKAGDRQCAPGVQGLFQVCEDRDGCLRWGTATECPSGQACVGAGECTAVCQSDPGCTKAGDRRCGAVAAYQECAEAAPGCFRYGTEQPCAGAQVCVGDGKCECQHACAAVGDRRCFTAEPDLYQACVEDAAGCRVWGEPAACDDGGVCKGAGVCEAVCTSDCVEVGKVECASGTQYRVCMTVQPGCLKWGTPVACPGALTCQAGQCQVQCTPDADCAAGKVGCADAAHQKTCEEVATGCLKWGAPAACELHQACGATGCACENPCEAGATECVGAADPHFRKVCRTDAGGCRFWAYEDCGGGATCDAGACVPTCGSDPDCTAAGVSRCESLDSFATCAEVAGHPGCIQFGAAQACPSHQECGQSSGQCACRVEAGCSQAGAKRCIDYDNAATCNADEKGCLYWGAPEPCPQGSTCAAGVCSPLCTSDLDCTGTGIARCTADGKQQVCTEVPGVPGCIKWAPAQDCPAHQACAEATGCVCANPCKSGEARCVGLHQHQACAAPDERGCTFWSPAETCDGNDACVQGACRAVASPVVSCGQVTLNLVNQGYSDVQVSGNFHGSTWETVPLALVAGVWTATVTVDAPGFYEYKFIADGTWVLDPLNPAVAGTPPMDNSVVMVALVQTCEVPGESRCTAAGTLETCQDVSGCLDWLPAADPCTTADHYCDAGQCMAIVSPLVTATAVTFTVRDQGFDVEVSGDFTSPPWGAFIPLAPLAGRRAVTLQLAEVPGLTAGDHPYKYRAPATGTWFYDPANPNKVDDGTGGFNSVVTVGNPCVPGCAPVGSTRCTAEAMVETCGPDETGCPAWTGTSCVAPTYCLRTTCEAFPVIGPGGAATFAYVDDGALAVKVRGEFTTPAWDEASAVVLTRANGLWTGATGPLAAGTYAYKFVVTTAGGDAWVVDAHNPNQVSDGMGGYNSVFTVP